MVVYKILNPFDRRWYKILPSSHKGGCNIIWSGNKIYMEFQEKYKCISTILLLIINIFKLSNSYNGIIKWFVDILLFSLKGMAHVPNMFMSFNKYSFLEVINILI